MPLAIGIGIGASLEGVGYPLIVHTSDDAGATNNGDGTFSLPANTNCRFFFPAASLVNGATYRISINCIVLSGGGMNSDFCDGDNFNFPAGAGLKTYDWARATYDSTYRFVDIFTGLGVTLTFNPPTLRRVS